MLVLLWASLIGLGATGFALNPAPGTDPPDADSPWLGKQAAQTFRFWAPEQDQGKTVHKILLNQRDAGNLNASGKTLSIAAGDMLSVRIENSEAGMVYRIRRTYPADGSFLDMVSQGGTLQFPEFSIPANGTHIMTVSANGTGDYQHSFVINVTDGKNAPVNAIFANAGNFTENGGETISVVPALDNNVSTICNGGSVVVSIHNSILNHTYRVRQTFPSQSTWKEKTGTGGTIEFDALVIVPPSSGDAIVSVQDRSDPDGLYVSFNVSIVSQPTAPVLTKVPDVASVCTGTSVKATLSTAGSGGVSACTDSYEYRTNGGTWSPWSTYTLDTEISTTGLSSVDIRAIRSDNTGAGCSATNMYSWVVNALPVPVITGESNVCSSATETYTTADGMTNYSWTISGGTGSSTSHSIDVTWGSSGTGSVSLTYTDANGCNPASATVLNTTITDAPSVTAATLLASLNQTIWQDVTGSIGSGYTALIYGCVDYTYLDINSFTTSPGIKTEHLHPFYLNQNGLPSNWTTYWAAKGVVSGATGWQGIMHDIINGNEPIFYIYKTVLGDYQLIDGLLYQTGQGMQTLRISGDYPLATYIYDGTVISEQGCATGLSIQMTLISAVLNYTQQKTYGGIQLAVDAASSGDVIEVCAGTYAGNIIIDKSITIAGNPGDAAPGPGPDAPVIDGGNAPGDAFKILNGVTNVTIKGFEIRNFTSNATGIGNGISAWVASTSNVNIEDNYFHNLGWNGVMVGNDGAIGSHTNWVIKNNILETFYAYGFELTNTSNSSIENNIIHSDATSNPYTCILILGHLSQSGITVNKNLIDGPFTGKGVGFPAIYVRAENGVNINNITIQQNGLDFTGTAQSVSLSADGTGTITNVALNYNRLSRLQLSKIYNDIDATNNFWGNANGPINSSVNTFNRGQQAGWITATQSWVPIIAPWWKDISGTPGTFAGTSFAPITNDQGKKFARFGTATGNASTDALSGTLANGTLYVEAGTYGENVAIPTGKPLTILGQNGTAYIGYASSAQGITLRSPLTFSDFSAYSTATNIEIYNGGLIQNGVDFALAGGTVKADARTWTEDVTVPAGKPLTLRNRTGTSHARIASGNKLTLSSPVTLLYFSAFDAGTLTQINEGGVIQNGVDFAATGGTVDVNSGAYDEKVLVNKGVIIKGIGATRPEVNFTGTVTGKPAIFDVSADGATIENIHFKVDLAKLRSAIIASAAGIDNIAVKDNVIDCYGTPAGSYGERNAVSINYAGYRVASGGVNNVIFTGNTVNFGTAGGFRSGISVDEAGGTFSGNTLASISHDILVRFAGNGDVTASGNFLNGGGMEFADFNAGAGTLTINGNQFNGAVANSYSNALRLKNNYTARPTVVSNNTFTGFVGNIAGYGGTLSLENYQEVNINNNTFTPLANSTDFRHITVNTKDFSSSSGTYAPVIGATLTNNTFNGSGTTGGMALGFYNWDNDSPVFNAFVIGTAENENTFNDGIATFIYLDNSSGTALPNNTTMVPWAVDLNVENNLFANSTPFAIEDKVFHAMDFVGLGLVTWVPSNVYVTTNTLGIQRGIDVVTNSTVNVGPGAYGITSQILINKSVNIIGYESPVVKALNNLNNGTAGYYIFRVDNAVTATVNISNMSLDGDVFNVYGGMRYHSTHSGTIDNCKFRNIKDTPASYAGFGIVNYGTLTIQNNEFSNIGRVGMWIGGLNNTISGNTYTGKGNGDWIDYGIEVGFGGTADIDYNTITNCNGVASVDGSASGGILISTYYGAGTAATIDNNKVTGNTNGIIVGFDGSDASTVSAHNNDLSGNSSFNLVTTASTVAASCNWWGTTNGTTIASKVSGGVIYDPWLTNGTDNSPDPGFQPVPGSCNGTTPAVTATPDHQICGESSGSIIIETMTGGVPPYTVYYGSNSLVPGYYPNTLPFGINNIAPGSYQVYITDANGTASPEVTVTIQYLPVHNTSTNTYHASIQSAIDAAADNHVIEVCAGTYAEDLVVNKPLDIRGPNYNISPNTGTRVAEAVIYPATSSPFGEIFKVQASNVKISGFTIDGDNPLLPASLLLGTNGATLDAAEAVTVYVDNVNNLTVSNNIIQNLTYYGVTIFGASYSSPTTTGHLISGNLIKDMGTYTDPEPNANSNMNYWGGGVLIYNDQYTRIVDNVMTNVRIGIQTGNFHDPNPGDAMYQVIDNNTIQARRNGIFYNLHTGNPAPLTFSNNTITALANANETKWRGIAFSSLSEAIGVASNNTINGSGVTIPSIGYEVWNVKGNAPASIIGGTVSNVDIGVFLNNWEGYASNGSNGAHASLSNLTISLKDGGTGLRLHDNPSSTHGAIQLGIGNDVIVNGGAKGLVLENTNCSISGAIGNLALNSQTGPYIELINNAGNIDATAVLYDGKTGATADPAENFAIEDKITHKLDNLALGFVSVKAGENFVTPASGSIQRGVDAASTGYIVNVAQGAFTENLNINKAVALKGANADATACGSRGPESKIAPASGLPVSVTADDVTINGFEITAPSYQNAIVCSNRSDLTISHNNIHDIGTSITNTNVHSIIYVVANAASTSNVNILDNCFNNISSSLLTGYSASAIGVLQSTSTGVLTGLNIERNTINNVNVNTSNWPTGKLAYGIIINVGSANYQTTNGKVTNAIISANEISGLSGFISTGIALEGNTENAIVQNNYVANISGNKTANREGGGYDLQGLKFETNRFIGTCTVQNNSFATDTYNHGNPNGVGYAVANYVPSTVGTAALGCNWYGTAVYNEIADNDDLTGKILNKDGCATTYVPYLVNGTDDEPGTTGFQSIPGTCEGEPVVIASAVATHIYCGETNGSILVTFSGGTAPYNITWTGGSDNEITNPYHIASLLPGNYTITVTDFYGSSDVIMAEVLYLPVTNTTASTYHPTIQAAIDAATAGDFINVCAGTYVESIVIDKGIVLRGPNYGKDPNVDDRVPEAVVEFTDWYGVYFDVANVTIDGFTFNGKGICDYGIYTYVSGAGGHLFTNNIVKNVNTMGYIGWVQTGIPSSQNIVTKNLFEDMPNARAVVTLWNYYANITNNVIQNTSVGLYAENANQPESSGLVEWKNNTISASRSGIWYNLAYGTATSLTIKDNIIDVEDNTSGTRWDGIWLTSLGGSINPVISGNIITGSTVTQQTNGYNLWNNTTTATDGITILGGSVTNVDYGVWINNWDGYPTTGSNAGSTKAKIDGITITDADLAGLYLKDNPLNTNGASAYVYAKLTNSTITGSGTGVLIQGDDASADVIDNPATITGNQIGILAKDGADLASVTGNTITNNTHGGIVIESTAGTIGVINNNTISGNGYSVDATHGLGLKNELPTSVDAQNNWWGHASGPYITPYNTCGLGNAVVGNVDFMPWWTTETGSPSSDLPVYNEDLDTYYCKIQDAIDDPLTLDGHEFTVAAGIYQENLLVNKELIITGAGAGTTTILAGAGVAVEVTADNVTIEGFEIKHSSVTTLADMGIRLNMSNGSTIQTNKFTSNSLGLQLLDAGSNTIYQNEFANNAIGIYFEGTTDGINFDGGSNGPFYSLSLNNVVEENNIHDNILLGGQGGQGIYLDAACEENSFINNTISNNAAIGYYAWKASNNTLTGNMIQNNSSEGIQLQGSSDNTITGNTVSGSPVGFWMRSPAENVTNNIITGNTITTNTVGIKMEDDYSTNNWPGIITGNTISGNKIFANTNYGLQIVDVAPATEIDATCNYWGTEDAYAIANAISGNVDFLEFLIVDNTNGNTYPWDNINKYACGGVGPVTVYNAEPLTTGTLVSSHMTIQAAIDASSTINGYYVDVAAGTYPEILYIHKALDIRGPNYGINPNTGTRNDEATIKFPLSNTSWYLMYIDGDGGGSTLSDISINGFAFDGFDSYGGTYPTELIFVAGAENVSIKDNILKNFESIAVRYYYQYYNGTSWVSTWPVGADISDNHISNPEFYSNGSIAPNTGIYLQGVYGSVTGNVVEGVLGGCQIQPYGHPNATSVTGTVTNNTFNASRNGLWYNNSSSATADWLFNGNTLSGIPHPSGYTPGASWYGEPTDIWYGFAINGNSFGEVAFTGNTIVKGTTASDAYGIRYVHGYAHAPATTITGNTINNLSYGIYLPVNLANVGEILINNNSISGNSAYGVYNGTTTDVNATANWWGSNNGPTYTGNPCGTGDAISANVLYDPWKNAASMDFDIYQLQAFTVTENSSICVGGTANITLNDSQLGTGFNYLYDLYKDDILVTGETKTGTGNALVWTVSTGSNATYTVKAKNDLNLCTLDMTGSATVFIGPITTLPTLTACANSLVEVPVTVTDFNDVGSISLRLKYDKTVMSYHSFSTVTGIAFDVVSDESGAEGILTIGAMPASQINLANEATLLTLKFNFTSGSGNLQFDDSYDTYCEYGSGPPSYVAFCDEPTSHYYINGSVSCETVPPTFTRPADITIYRDENCSYDASTSATGDVTNEADNCGVGQATYSDAVNASNPCSVIITRTWSLVDNCGNAAADQVQTITVEDNTSPSATAPTAVALTCATELPAAATTITEFLALSGSSASDNCTPQDQLSVTSVTATLTGSNCIGSITRTYTITDLCGNFTQVNQTFNISDNIVPMMTGPADREIEGCSELTALPEPKQISLAASGAAGVYYPDRYAPHAFEVANFNGGERLKHQIDASACQECRPGSYSSAFYNTQGRKYNTPGALSLAIDLYVPSEWATTGRRMAGLWGTAYDATNAISCYPIIEFCSEGGTPRFRGWSDGIWIDMGLPSGFAYNQWYTLSIRLVGETFILTVEDLNLTIPALGSVSIENMILQGHNTTTPGVTYDIYWDNFRTQGVNLAYSENPVSISASQYSAEGGSVTDNCTNLNITYVDTKSGTCPTVVTRTFTATDACGNNSSVSQTITIDDNTAPAWTIVAGTLNISVECSDEAALATAQMLAPVAIDNCSSVTYLKSSGNFVAGTCGATGSYTNTWIAKDECLNESTVFTQVITITDATAPTWTTFANALDISVECSDAAGLTAAQAMDPVATDNCGNVTYTKTPGDLVAGSCGATGSYTNTWIAKDECLNESTVFTQVITITDATAPTWTTFANALDISVECSDAAGLTAAQAMAPVATDNCGNVTYTKTSGDLVAGSCGATGSYTNTWIAKDECLNESTVFTQVITITDVTAPTWTTLANALDISVECSDAPGLTAAQAMAPVATDNCGNVTYTKTSGDFVPGSCGATGSYTNTWIAKDECLNESMVFTQVITITDVTAPTWTTLANALDISVECSDAAGLTAAQAMAPVATDNCGNVTYTKTSGDFVAGSCGATGSYTNTWIAKDECLNESMVFTQVITINDATAPTWTTFANALDISVECSDAAGLTAAQAMAPVATDNCGNVTYTKTSGDFVAGSCGATGSYTNTWIAKDECLNESTVFTQVITITDVTAPTWTTLANALDISVECSEAAGLTAAQAMAPVATDNCGNVTYTKTSGDFVPGSCGATGSYTNTWVANDACSNPSSTFTQIITITDVTPPTITPPADVTTVTNDGCTATGVDLGTPVVDDNCTATGDLTVTNDAPTAFPFGQTIVTWTVTDGCGNSAQATQTVTVGGHTLSGTFQYYGLNPNGTPKTSFDNLSGIDVELWQNNVKVYPATGTITTDASGAYTFTGICSGAYQVVASTTKSTIGAINSTDAAQVNYWGVIPYEIQLVRFYTGDGVMDNYLDGSDASRILKNFTTSGTWGWVNRGPWTFWLTGETIDDNILSPPAYPYTQIDLPSITITNTSLTKDFYGMVTGDFNGSFVPSAKSYGHSLTLSHPRMRTVEKGQEILLPVTAPEALEASAVSLIMEYPADRFEITGVFFGTDPSSDVEWAVNDNGELRLGWFALQPAMLDAGDVLLTLRVRVTGDIALDETLVFSLTQEATNEIADGRFLSNGPTELHMDALTGKSTGTHENPEQHTLNLTCFPNPFRGTTTLAYSLPADGKVTLDIASMLGTQITTLVDEAQTAGDHTLTLDASTLKPGVYTATLRLDSDGAQLVRTIRIVRSK